ncbi:MAG TPA: hypothetical protein VJ625_13215 [Propionibacteriaceae bacterium]|nr:hypothetical protein [Propionibacteriaceae bacterium]
MPATPMTPEKDDAKELAAARAVVRGYIGDVPAVWALAIANDEPPPLVSDNARWYEPRFGRDPTTGRALNADGSVNRAGRPPGAYTRNGEGSGRTYANSHRARKYADSGVYEKTALSRVAEVLAEHS